MNSPKVCLCRTIISRTLEPPCAHEYELLKNISRSIISFGARNCVKHSRNYAWGSRNFHYITRALFSARFAISVGNSFIFSSPMTVRLLKQQIASARASIHSTWTENKGYRFPSPKYIHNNLCSFFKRHRIFFWVGGLVNLKNAEKRFSRFAFPHKSKSPPTTKIYYWYIWHPHEPSLRFRARKMSRIVSWNAKRLAER